jgi:hypothetical protein
MNLRVYVACALALLLTGCAVGNTYDYRSQTPQLDISSSEPVLVVVQDQRTEVVTGDKEPQFVGLQRGGYGNPFDVRTTSGHPLADDFAEAIVRSLAQGGVAAQSIPLAPSADKQAAIDAALARGGSKFLLVCIRQWKSDTYVNVALTYDLQADVLDADGVPLATNSVSAKEDLGGDFINPPSHAGKAVPEAFRRVLQRLLGDAKIKDALG